MAAFDAAVRYKDLTQSWSDPSGHLRILGPADAVDNRPVILTLTLRYLAASETNTWDYILEMVKLCVAEDGDLLTLGNGPVQVSGAPTAGTFMFQPREHILLMPTHTADPTALLRWHKHRYFHQGPGSERATSRTPRNRLGFNGQ